MRNAITMESGAEDYVSILENFEDIFDKKNQELLNKEGIIDIKNIEIKTNELINENFLTNKSDDFHTLESASLKVMPWNDIRANVDDKVAAIQNYSNSLVPTTESGYYESELERERHVEGLSKVVVNTLSLYTNGNGDYNSFIEIGKDDNGSSVFEKQPQIYNSAIYDAVGALESYGVHEQNFAFDLRTAMMISATNYLTSIEDKLFARHMTPNAKIRFEIDNIVKYDYAKNKSLLTTGDNARGDDIPISYVQLNKDPTSINTKSRPVKFHVTHNNLYSTGTLPEMGKKINIFQTVYDGATTDPVYQAFGESDRISDGAKINTLYLYVTKASGNSRLYEIDVSYRDDCYFTKAENMKESSERILNLNLNDVVVKDSDASTLHSVGSTAPLTSMDDDSHLSISVNVNGRFNLRTSEVQVDASGIAYSVKVDATGDASAVSADTTLKTALDGANGEVKIVAYELDAQYTEENIRKSNVAIRTNRTTKTARVPHGRTYIFETQALPKQTGLEPLITNVNNIIGIGNLTKLLTVWEDFVDNSGKALKRDRLRVKRSTYDDFAANFVTHNTILPSIETLSIDFGANAANVVSKRDHELTEDVFGKFKREMNSFINKLMTESCYTCVLNSGEKFRWVGLTHFSVINTILTPSLTNDTKEFSLKMTGGGSVILELAKNIEIEFRGISFDSLEKTILMAPVRANNRAHASSFGQILDVGTYSGSYLTGDSAVSRKHVVNSRESFYITTPVAAKINLVNLNGIYPSQS